MLRKPLVALCAMILTGFAFADDKQDYENVWIVDYRGKPPYKRTLTRLPVSDVAQFEVEQETVTLNVKKGSRPPFKRVSVELAVSDLAPFELEESSQKDRLKRRRAPFKR